VTYRVILDVQSRILPTLLQTIDGNADIKLVAVTDAQNPALPPSPLPPTPAALQPSINAVPQRHIRADALIEETLRSGPAQLNEIRRVFEHGGFAPGSAAATLSRMLKAGRVQRGFRGRYSLTGIGRNGAA
jgi:hypothetical protein